MIFRLDDIKAPVSRREADPVKMASYTAHFGAKMSEFGYVRDELNGREFDRLAVYFARYCAAYKGEADYPEKGLFLYGKAGTGKTKAMRIFSALFGVEFVPVWQMTRSFTSNGARAFWDWMGDFHHKPLIIDDIANESMAKSFGNAFPITDVLAMRNDDSALTFFTSNANGEKVTDLYGDYIYSRICGMCEPIQFQGHDFRRLKK